MRASGNPGAGLAALTAAAVLLTGCSGDRPAAPRPTSRPAPAAAATRPVLAAAPQIVIDTKSSIDIGVKKVGETYSFICDWESLETHAGIEQKDFMKQIVKAYAYENVMEQISKKGYTVAEEKTDQHQHIHITVRKWS